MQSKGASELGARGAAGRRAFTLVELLVVIGIIAVLISILLPSLNQARRKAQGVACMNQGRQIYLAMLMFAQDNKGHLPRPYGVGQLSSDATLVKLCAWLQEQGGASGHVDMRDEMGALWKYIPGQTNRENLLMCPGDTGEALAGHPVVAAYPRNISYSMNARIQSKAESVLNRPLLGIRIGSVRAAAEKIMLYEELAPNDSWCIMAMSNDDIPSGRHGINLRGNARNNPNSRDYYYSGRGNHTFFDGHVEALSPSSLLPPRGRGNPFYHGPLTEDDLPNLPVPF